jgi:hypothetical protein
MSIRPDFKGFYSVQNYRLIIGLCSTRIDNNLPLKYI